MKKKIDQHTVSIGHALDGLLWAYNTQPNYRVHVGIALLVVIAGIVLGLSYVEWLISFMIIMIGLVIETINTAIEATTDAITKDWKKEIMIAKDVSAAAMLTYAIGAAIIGCIIFIPKIVYFVRY